MFDTEFGTGPGTLSPAVPVVTALLVALFVIGLLYRLVGLL
ncbi:hypothetical protein [Halalkalicoccus jeotgali]|uniref:Uncharacterized protein n=1 Tax=Halalkalicoccus jeotgali (strain DSM 18796 / CECT 7217 / JCM 14584 / KCTC 4019 / B3) TaxID=795797 RepID=D8JAN4_HALJB|nr:hypothetical protein [Halalkalicoccus jeotgali]ADJ14756.1 hypothetical protein HacjB3_06845 [Halalkalicoccus jeotgali B3]ELY39338.1 hypothetical protein C497_05252 [Halalkalicoccus jeotgali B3]